MKNVLIKILAPFIALAQISGIASAGDNSATLDIPDDATCPEFLNHSFKKLHSPDEINLCTLYTGKPVLFVNTASHCGFTPQFKGLEALYQKYKGQGVQVIGFASNDFRQAAKTEEKAAEVCYKNYGVSFTMLAQTKVRGNDANPVFKFLGEKTKKPSWNFNKYLLLPNKKEILRFGARAKPLGAEIEKAIQQSLELTQK